MIKSAAFFLASAGTGLACQSDGVRLDAKSGAPAAYVTLGNIPMAQPFAMQVTFCEPAGAKSLEVDALMPAHQHGMNYVPVVQDTGGGAFEVTGMLFHMPGVWEMRFSANIDGDAVTYTHSITLK